MRDSARQLNFSHEYQLVFVETADFSTNQFVVKTGTLLGESLVDGERLVIQSNVNNATTLHDTAFTENVWHNYALLLNFDQKWVLESPNPSTQESTTLDANIR